MSFDFINRDNDPTPRFSLFSIQTHGTKCAGIVGMAKDNGKCGVGVSYNSKIAGKCFYALSQLTVGNLMVFFPFH